jgi:hypothetical protein
MAVLKICPEPHCGRIVTDGGGRAGVKCILHRKGSGLKTKRWERRSRLERTEHPLCADHLALGQYVPATDTHHVVKRADGGELLADEMLTLCKACHAVRTAKGE